MSAELSRSIPFKWTRTITTPTAAEAKHTLSVLLLFKNSKFLKRP
jgi:hypothetical protein